MATVMVPTMSTRVDPNPRGSATAHVTMPAANPFEREALSVRAANQPVTYNMLPGLGADLTNMKNTLPATTEAAAPTTPAAPSAWATWGHNLLNTLTEHVAVPYIQQEVLKPQQPAQQLTAPTYGVLPTVNPNISQMPMAAPKTSMTPFIIAGVGLLAVGGIFLMGKGRKAAPARRRSTRRR